MSSQKAERYFKDASRTEGIRIHKLENPASSRSDIFSKLAKFVSLSEFRGNKAPVNRRELRHPENLVDIGDKRAHSPVTVRFAPGSGLPTSSSMETLRSSSDSNLAAESVKCDGNPGQGTNPPILTTWSQICDTDRSWGKREKQSVHRRTKVTPLCDPPTSLTPIPESVSVSTRNSLLPEVKARKFADEDALMETDSQRARAAIALARAQLEHSRPASYFRKLERSSNEMMMLPGELEEHFAFQKAKFRGENILARLDMSVLRDDAATKASAYDNANGQTDEEFDHMQKVVRQSQAMVLTLMAAQKAVSQRSMSKSQPSTPTSAHGSAKLERPSKSSWGPGPCRAEDIPPTPPPSIPLPQLPFEIAHGSKVTRSKSQGSRRRPGVGHHSSAYKELSTEYRSDDEVLQHIDMLMQSLLDSEKSSHESSPQKSYYSLPSRRGRSESEPVVPGGVYQHDRQIKPSERSSSMTPPSKPRSSTVRQAKRPAKEMARVQHCGAAPTSPTTYCETLRTVPGAHFELEFRMLPAGSAKAAKRFNSSYNDAFHPSRSACNMSTRAGYDTLVRDASLKSGLPNLAGGNTEKYFQQFTPPLRHPRHYNPTKI